ncbi:hypothetical protein GCM10017556_38100 [Micromonospora sagamiensis]|nr:hypothetical protein GCM10017556_38100 [Micromonospora sagamiensis]
MLCRWRVEEGFGWEAWAGPAGVSSAAKRTAAHIAGTQAGSRSPVVRSDTGDLLSLIECREDSQPSIYLWYMRPGTLR